ncbi:MAG: isoleucine--tRNA ligase [Thermoplasmatota archaeon]
MTPGHRSTSVRPPSVRAAEKEYNPVELEARIRESWEITDAYARAREARRGAEPWYFIDGPPYATGGIHFGTARNKTLKDAIVRVMRMRGFDVRDQAGFDMHGLPIEVKVEQQLGFRTKKDIEAYGIDAFVKKCREFGMGFKDIMTKEFEELGVWLDWEHPYLTITNDYIEGAWWALAQAHSKGLLYESERVLTWCWRCETALAAAEVEYSDRDDPSVYVRFRLVDRPDESLLVWTTTPWTLPANVAVAANPDLRYARMRLTMADGRSEVLIAAEPLAEAIARVGRAARFEILSTMSGRELEGLRYVTPFAREVPYHAQGAAGPSDRRYSVLLSTHVEADRTGLVHTATGHGVEDFEVGARYGIAPFCPVGENGAYTVEAGPLQGLAVKASDALSPADARVLALLSEKGLLYAKGTDRHSYGHCWRCKNPIIFRVTRQWFLAVTKIKDKMLSEVDRVKWTPEWAGSARQRDWVENARDWCITRQRYWGIPMPVWRCAAGHIHVVGSRDELEKDALNYDRSFELHRPWIDDVLLRCKQCGDDMRRVPDVLDVWFDSAVASWSELGFPEETKEFEKWFPADFIVEGLDQTRGWFYSQLAAGVASHGRVPYESVLMHGWVNDEQGRPMSKSLGNYIPPHEVIVKHGADAVRFELVRAGAPWDDLSFGWEGVKIRSRFLNVLWNVHVFATRYMALDAFAPQALVAGSAVPPKKTSRAAARPPRKAGRAPAWRIEDLWLQSRIAGLTARVNEAFRTFELHLAAREIERFVLEDLSRWYVRLVRDRVWQEDPKQEADKNAAYETLHAALLTSAKLLAPFAPFIADALYQDLDGTRGSVHLEDWPTARPGAADLDLERHMEIVRSIVDAAANARQRANMKLRWPVARLVVAGDKTVEQAVRRLEPLLLEMANAKRIDFAGEAWEGLAVVAQPVKNAIGPVFKARAGEVIAAIQAADGKTVRAAIAQGVWDAKPDIRVLPSMVTFETRLPDHVAGSDFAGGAVYLDTEVTDDLKAEGYARDVARRIQELRKRANLPMDARIRAEVGVATDLRRLLEPHEAVIRTDTRADAITWIEPDATPAGNVSDRWEVDGEAVTIGITFDAPDSSGSAETRPGHGPGRRDSGRPRSRSRSVPHAPSRTGAARGKKQVASRRKTAGRSKQAVTRARMTPRAPGRRAMRVRPRSGGRRRVGSARRTVSTGTARARPTAARRRPRPSVRPRSGASRRTQGRRRRKGRGGKH